MEKEEIPAIPFMGDDSVTNNISVKVTQIKKR